MSKSQGRQIIHYKYSVLHVTRDITHDTQRLKEM